MRLERGEEGGGKVGASGADILVGRLDRLTNDVDARVGLNFAFPTP